MPKLKPDHVSPTDEEEIAIQRGIDADPDNPELDDEWFARSRPAREFFSEEVYAALTDKSKPATITLVSDEEDRARQKRMGRPRVNSPKVPIHIRISPDVLDAFKAAGRGWQTRMNAVLREAVEAGKV